MKEITFTLHDGDMITPLRNMTNIISYDEKKGVPYETIMEQAIQLVFDWKGLKENPDTAKEFYGDDED